MLRSVAEPSGRAAARCSSSTRSTLASQSTPNVARNSARDRASMSDACAEGPLTIGCMGTRDRVVATRKTFTDNH